MVKSVKIGGEERPVKFGFSALMNFCDIAGYKLNDLGRLGEDMTLGDAVNLIWCGLKDGARAEKKEFTLTSEDVADFLDDDIGALNDVLAVFAESFTEGEK
jgi:hypothetical protein